MVERARLLIECTCLKCAEGSNPSHSENFNFLLLKSRKYLYLTLYNIYPSSFMRIKNVIKTNFYNIFFNFYFFLFSGFYYRVEKKM